MKFAKKILITCTMLSVSLLSFVGCGSSNNTSTSTSTNTNTSTNAGTDSAIVSSINADTITLNLWHYYNGTTKDILDNIITEFNDTEGTKQNIYVNAVSYSSVSDLAKALVSSANKEVGVPDMPEIASAYSDTALLLNDMGMLADMDLYFSDSELALFQQDFLIEGRFASDNSLKIIPVAKSTEVLFINKTGFDIFSDETGVQMSQLETWEGIAEVAEIYYEWSGGHALFGLDSTANFMLIASRQLGNEVYDYGDNSVSFGLTEDSALKIWDTIFTPYMKDHYTAFGSYRADDVKSGDILLYAGSTSSVNYFPTTVELGRADAYDITGTVMGYPYFEDGDKIVVQQGAGMIVPKTDEVKEQAAAEFLKWFTSAEYNLDFAVSTGYIPVQNDALSYDGVLAFMVENSEDDITDIFLDVVDVTYNNVMQEYEFYANKPFDGSYDTRNVLANSMLDLIDDSLEQKAELIDSGLSEQEAFEIVSGEEAFAEWYTSLKTSINDILDEYN